MRVKSRRFNECGQRKRRGSEDQRDRVVWYRSGVVRVRGARSEERAARALGTVARLSSSTACLDGMPPDGWRGGEGEDAEEKRTK